jgi:hypothetical protein
MAGYIWNVDQTLRLIADLKQIAPDVVVVLGGPEVSYDRFGLKVKPAGSKPATAASWFSAHRHSWQAELWKRSTDTRRRITCATSLTA